MVREELYMNEEKKKPFILELEDAKTEFIQLIQTLQGRGLSCYCIEMALSDVWSQVKSVAKQELEVARKQMEE